MKRTSVALLLGTAFVLTGCKGEEEAREYAKGLLEVLKLYQAQVQVKIGAEQKAYKDLAVLYGQAADSDLLASFGTERRERGDRLADRARRGGTPTGTEIKDLLKEYAVRESDATRELLFRESDNYDKYLSTANALSLDAGTIEAARKALEPLTKSPSVLDELKFLREFGNSTKNCLDEMVCRDLARDLEATEKTIAALGSSPDDETKRKALNATATSIKARQKAAGCEKNPSCAK